jgi:hypothetical protein
MAYIGNVGAFDSVDTEQIVDGAVTNVKITDVASSKVTGLDTAISTAVSDLVAGAPSTLDTLNELAAALGDDANFATTVTNSIAAKLPLVGGTMTGNIATAGISSVTAGTSNFVAGVNAGNSITVGGDYNTVIGDESGTAITTGDQNAAVGYQSLAGTTTGRWNTAIGYQTLMANTTGNGNTATGSGTMAANTTGTTNSAYGWGTLAANTTGSNNQAFGGYSLQNNTSGSFNTGAGLYASAFNTTGYNNTAAGYASLFRNTTGNHNIGIGSDAGDNITTGSNNIILGSGADAGSATADYQLNIGGWITGLAGAITIPSTLSVGGDVSNTSTGSVQVSQGTTAQRPAGTDTGRLRYNSTEAAFEGYTSAGWGEIGGGGPSLGTDSVIRTNAKVIAENITFAGTENGSSVGPITINSGYTVTVESGSTWVIL